MVLFLLKTLPETTIKEAYEVLRIGVANQLDIPFPPFYQ